jgi:predicted transcriptional regulator
MSMIDDSMFNARKLLEEGGPRRILEYLLKNKAASDLKLSYSLRMKPDEIDEALRKLEEARLVRPELTKGLSGRTYIPTEMGFAMEQYLSRPGPETRQYRR